MSGSDACDAAKVMFLEGLDRCSPEEKRVEVNLLLTDIKRAARKLEQPELLPLEAALKAAAG